MKINYNTNDNVNEYKLMVALNVGGSGTEMDCFCVKCDSIEKLEKYIHVAHACLNVFGEDGEDCPRLRRTPACRWRCRSRADPRACRDLHIGHVAIC